VSRRGGWPRAELHHGLILQNASVYTISRAARTFRQATEDPLNLEFLSFFRCKCWRLNVILLHDSSDCLTNTWWSMKTIKREVFCDRVSEWWVHARSISPTHADGYFRSCHFSNVYRYVNNCASREMQIYTAQPRIMISSKRSLLKCDFFWPRVIVYIFAFGSKIVLFPNLLLRNWRDIVYFIGVYRTLCTVSTYVTYVTYPEIIVQYSTVLRKMCLCTLSLLVIELKLSCNLEYSGTLLKYP